MEESSEAGGNLTTLLFGNGTNESFGGITSYVMLSQAECAVAIVIYTLISFLALVGNAVVIFIIARFKRLRTPTNLLICNLAIADLLMAIFCIPLAYFPNLILAAWPFGGLMCKVIHYCQVSAVLGTSYTLVAISFDRFIAILFPFKPNLRLTHRNVVVLIMGIWVLSGFFGLPDLIGHSLRRMHDGPDGQGVYECAMGDWRFVESATGLSMESYGVLVFALQFWIPLLVLISTYTGIGVVIWQSRRQPGAASESERALKQQADRHDSAVKMILMMLLVTVLFVICWFPQNILMNYLYNYTFVSNYRYIYHVWWGTHTFAMSHSFVNPIIYVCRNSKFREGFAYVFRFLPGVHYEAKELADRRRATVNSTLRMVTAYMPMNGAVTTQEAIKETSTLLTDDLA